MTAIDADERRAAARTRILRGLALLTLSPVAFQLAGPLAVVFGVALAKWSMTVTAIALAAAGSKRVVLGAFDHYDAKRALPVEELPTARLITSESERRASDGE